MVKRQIEMPDLYAASPVRLFGLGRHGDEAAGSGRNREVAMSVSASSSVRIRSCRYGLTSGFSMIVMRLRATMTAFRGVGERSFMANQCEASSSQLHTGPRHQTWRLVSWTSGLDQVSAGPLARLGTRRKRSEIGIGNAAEGPAAIRTTVRDNVVARVGRSFHAAISSLNELDRGIQVVAADGARAPDSHVRRQLLFRLIRYPCRDGTLWRSKKLAGSLGGTGCCRRASWRN